MGFQACAKELIKNFNELGYLFLREEGGRDFVM
jgi:hypothetical protein